jgi:hypothetical protein
MASSAAAQDEPAVRLERDNPFEIIRFNRGEGLSAGYGATAIIRGSASSVLGRARYSLGDERVQGSIGMNRIGPRGRMEIVAFSAMRDADPLAPGLSVTNTIPALLLSHDEGSYVFASGVAVRRTGPWRGSAELTMTLFYRDESAPRATTRGGLFNAFPPNTPVLAGGYFGFEAGAAGGEIGGDDTWFAGLEGTAGRVEQVRAWIGLTRRGEIGSGIDVMIAGWAGGGVGSERVPQRDFRLGGNRTLRGYDAGSARGEWAWNVAVDVGAAHLVVAPVAFADVGQAQGSGVKASVGAGVSLLRGLARAHVATPLERARARFDLMFAVRR